MTRPAAHVAALRAALAGIPLTPDEEKLVAWMERICDFWTVATVAGLISRVRGTGARTSH